jgi:hypothetical protein
MTRRSSVRAQARRNYCELAGKSSGQQASAPTPDPSPRAASARRGGEQKVETKLTKRIRALYEDSAVPVREIAAIAGVSERTLYTYVEKHAWKRRHRCAARDEAVAAANRGRRWRAQPDVTPAKGAGGRFIRREDKDKPFASGLKALDPAGRRRAEARCATAEPLSREALEEALAAQRHEERTGIIQEVNQAIDRLCDFRDARRRHGYAESSSDRTEAVLERLLDDAIERWAALLAENKRQDPTGAA